jgi:hypothetical protein
MKPWSSQVREILTSNITGPVTLEIFCANMVLMIYGFLKMFAM